MCGYFCIGFIDFMSKGQSFLGYTNIYFEKNKQNNTKTFSIVKTFCW